MIMKKTQFGYELSHEQFKNLFTEMQAINHFNFMQFKHLNAVAAKLIEVMPDTRRDEMINVVRNLQDFNGKQYKKLNFIINMMKKTVDPQYKPPTHVGHNNRPFENLKHIKNEQG